MTGELDTKPVSEKLIERLMELLKLLLGDRPEVAEVLQDILPALVTAGISKGAEYALDTMRGLASAHPRPYWDRLIRRAGGRQRIRIMEAARQSAHSETIAKIKRERLRWEAFLNILKGACLIAPLLL